MYQSLFDEVRRRTGYSNDIYSFDELVNKKGIGRTMLDQWLNNIVSKDFDELWKRIENRLNVDNFAINEIKRLHSSWTDFEIACLSHDNGIVTQIRKKVKETFINLDNKGYLNGLDVKETLNQMYLEYTNNPVSQMVYNDSFIKAVILNEIYE